MGAALIVSRIDRDPTRGEVFWFLFDQHDTILDRAQGKRISWKTLLGDIQQLGLKNANGHPLDSGETLKSTFKRVCVFKHRLAEVKQKAAEPRKPPTTNTPPPLAVRSFNPVATIGTDRDPIPEGMDRLEALILRKSNKYIR